MKKEPMDRNVSFMTSNQFAHEIRMAAAKLNQTPSAFVRDAISHYMEWQREQEQEKAAAER